MDAHVISSQAAIDFLTTPRPSWTHILGQPQKVRVMRNPRGAGGKVDLRCYAGMNANGKPVVVARVGMAPYGGAPAKAAVGADLAPRTCYLMRLAAAGGLTHEDVVNFVGSVAMRLHTDLGERFRYMLSLDSPEESLISVESFGDVLTAARAVTGRVYAEAGALYAGMTKTRKQVTRYATPNGEICSVYRNGRNYASQIPNDCRPIEDGAKNRWVFVLAPQNSLEYTAWRAALPAWVREPEWGGVDGLGWTQPRLLLKRTWKGITAQGAVNDLVRLAMVGFGHLLPRDEEVTGQEFAQLISWVYDIKNPRTQAIVSGLCT